MRRTTFSCFRGGHMVGFSSLKAEWLGCSRCEGNASLKAMVHREEQLREKCDFCLVRLVGGDGGW